MREPAAGSRQAPLHATRARRVPVDSALTAQRWASSIGDLRHGADFQKLALNVQRENAPQRLCCLFGMALLAADIGRTTKRGRLLVVSLRV